MYFLTIEDNLFGIQPRKSLALFMMLMTIISLIILWIQTRYSPRLGIKLNRISKFLNSLFSESSQNMESPYKRKFDRNSPKSLVTQECVICMISLWESSKYYLETPCSHSFHEACLLRWVK